VDPDTSKFGSGVKSQKLHLPKAVAQVANAFQHPASTVFDTSKGKYFATAASWALTPRRNHVL
jgi:hypothetical protein